MFSFFSLSLSLFHQMLAYFTLFTLFYWPISWLNSLLFHYIVMLCLQIHCSNKIIKFPVKWRIFWFFDLFLVYYSHLLIISNKMLSYLRRKLSDSDARNSNSSTNATATKRGGLQTMSSLPTEVEVGEDTLLQDLGYRDATELQETVFGRFKWFTEMLLIFEWTYLNIL